MSETPNIHELARQKWLEFKSAFSEITATLSNASNKLKFEFSESGDEGFAIDRIVNGHNLRVVDCRFNSNILAIYCNVRNIARPYTRTINVLLTEGSMFFSMDGRGLILPEFVAQTFINLTRF